MRPSYIPQTLTQNIFTKFYTILPAFFNTLPLPTTFSQVLLTIYHSIPGWSILKKSLHSLRIITRSSLLSFNSMFTHKNFFSAIWKTLHIMKNYFRAFLIFVSEYHISSSLVLNPFLSSSMCCWFLVLSVILKHHLLIVEKNSKIILLFINKECFSFASSGTHQSHHLVEFYTPNKNLLFNFS